MPVTVKVNGAVNSLCHKGSNGVSIATIPDVCKTPSPGGPIPIPYPNISQSAMLAKGTTTVKADGMMAAIKGSEFSLSNGDNAGVAGGVKSSTFMKESTWILYSFDVKMDGQGACRLTDKKFQNHENTADLGGLLQAPLTLSDLKECEDLKSMLDQTVAGELPPSRTEGATVAVGSTSGGVVASASSISQSTVKKGGKYSSYCQGIKQGQSSNVMTCDGETFKYNENAGRPKEGHAEAKMIEDFFKGGAKGKLVISVSRAPCDDCTRLINEVNRGKDGKKCDKVQVCP